MKQVLNIKMVSDSEFKVDVGSDVKERELEFGITDVMYHLVIKYMEYKDMKMTDSNFDKTANEYCSALNNQLHIMHDIKADKGSN
ncbi:hypothetical protein [Companilactobacillus nodensis]|nr:hypothetical protein [Companilactobacillus nodensis]